MYFKLYFSYYWCGYSYSYNWISSTYIVTSILAATWGCHLIILTTFTCEFIKIFFEYCGREGIRLEHALASLSCIFHLGLGWMIHRIWFDVWFMMNHSLAVMKSLKNIYIYIYRWNTKLSVEKIQHRKSRVMDVWFVDNGKPRPSLNFDIWSWIVLVFSTKACLKSPIYLKAKVVLEIYTWQWIDRYPKINSNYNLNVNVLLNTIDYMF
jgi:hypothetical protein